MCGASTSCWASGATSALTGVSGRGVACFRVAYPEVHGSCSQSPTWHEKKAVFFNVCVDGAGKAARTLAAWLKSEALKRQKQNGASAPAEPLSVCIITSARLALDVGSLSALCQSAAAAGVCLHIFCCSQQSHPGSAMAAEVLAAAPRAAEHGARLSTLSSGAPAFMVPALCT